MSEIVSNNTAFLLSVAAACLFVYLIVSLSDD